MSGLAMGTLVRGVEVADAGTTVATVVGEWDSHGNGRGRHSPVEAP